MGYRVAIVGATGNVGREMLSILEELNFPVDEMHALASRKSKGIEVSFGDKTVRCQDIDQFDFSKVDLVLMSAGGAVSREWSEKIGKAGPIVIDNSSAFRKDPDVPLIVPEVNPDHIKLAKKKNIVANPNCSTAQLVVALKPLHDAAKIKRAVVSTYQSVSGAGKEGMEMRLKAQKGAAKRLLRECEGLNAIGMRVRAQTSPFGTGLRSWAIASPSLAPPAMWAGKCWPFWRS